MREARETKYWLELIQGVAPARIDAIAPLLAECKELIAMTTAALKKLPVVLDLLSLIFCL